MLVERLPALPGQLLFSRLKQRCWPSQSRSFSVRAATSRNTPGSCSSTWISRAASYFTLTDQHQIPYTLQADDSEVHQNANDMTGEFRDTNLAAVCSVASILYTAGDPDGPAEISTGTEEHPCAPWDVIQVGGNSEPAAQSPISGEQHHR